MKTLCTILTFVILLAFIHPYSPRNYYFSTAGNDVTGDGTIGNPYKTLTKLNSVWLACNPGDSLLLNKGETFYGSVVVGKSGSSSLPIILSSYGTGAEPIISGLTQMNSWVSIGGNIYTSTLSGGLSTLNMLLVNGTQTAMGRYPNVDAANKGYLTITGVATDTVTIAALASSPSFTNAEFVVKPRRWVTDRTKITIHSGQKLKIAGTTYTPYIGCGGFIQNSIKTLDQQWEWYYNPTTQVVFVYSTIPIGTAIKAGTQSVGITSSSKSYFRIIGVAVNGFNSHGISISGGTDMKVLDCPIINSGNTGILLTSCKRYDVQNNTINNAANLGVSTVSADYGTIENNSMDSIYILEGMGVSGEGKGSAINVSGTTAPGTPTDILFNTIKHVGYCGIRFKNNDGFSMDSIHVNYNLVDSFCYFKDDGAGIYTWAGYSHTVKHRDRQIMYNTILHAMGRPEGVPNAAHTGPMPAGEVNEHLAAGIYADIGASDINIEYNNVFHMKHSGIFLNFGTKRNNVIGNILYDCGQTGINIRTRVADTTKLNVFSDNSIINPGYYGSSHARKLINSTNITGVSVGTFSNNHYVSSSFYTTTPFYFSADKTFAQWQSSVGDIAASLRNVPNTAIYRDDYATASSNVLSFNDSSWVNAKGITYTARTLTPYTGDAMVFVAYVARPLNAFPSAVNDNGSGIQDNVISGNVVTNDTVSTDTPNTWTLVGVNGGALHGTVSMTSAGNYTYTPVSGYSGSDNFSYKICDVTPDCDTAIVSLTITAVDHMPSAVADTKTMNQDTTTSGNSSTNDTPSSDGGNVWSVVSGPSHGSVFMTTAGVYTYVPSAGYVGTDSFTYHVCDADGDCSTATVTITINAQSPTIIKVHGHGHLKISH